MLSPADFRDIVSGQRRGARAALWRALLRGAEIPYALGVRWRNRRFDRGKSTMHRVDVPVICVGNLTTGGTGKTPMVEWIARWFRTRGLRVALVSRGYGADKDGINDEALELEQRLPGIPHLQDPDRVKIARVAIEQQQCKLIVLDDGFQHRRLHRDLDIVLIDALEPFGYGHLLPRGLLREPLSGLRRAQVIALSRSDAVTDARRAAIRDQVRRIAPQAVWIEVAHQPQSLLSSGGDEAPIDSLVGQSIAAFCGIGNPAGFRHTLESCGLRIARFREFPDHHRYDGQDMQLLASWSAGASAVVCTHKDLVKIGEPRIGQLPLWALKIGLQVLAGHDELVVSLQSVLD